MKSTLRLLRLVPTAMACAAAALSLGILAPSSASALPVNLNFIELPNEGGIHLTGNNAIGGSIDVTTPSAEAFHISSPVVPNGYSPDAIIQHIGISQQGGDRLFVLLDSPGGPVSDYVWVHILGGADTVIDFISDTETPLVDPSTPIVTLVETGALDFLGSYTSDDGTLVNISVQSDVEVPEPSTLALFGAALLGFGARRLRRKAKA
jgi:hypothetical protein